MKRLNLHYLFFLFLSNLISAWAIPTYAIENCRYTFDAEIVNGARRLHSTWQNATQHPTRYRLAKDENQGTYASKEVYFKRYRIPQVLKKFYRLNHRQQIEEDIKQIPFDYLSYGNRIFTLNNAESIGEQVQRLLSLRPKTSDQAIRAILDSLQSIHSKFLQLSSRRYQRSSTLNQINSDLRLSNVLPLAREFSLKKDPQNFFHLLIERALGSYITSIRTDQFLRYTELPFSMAYYKMLSDRGQRLPLDDLARRYFSSSMTPITIEKFPEQAGNELAVKAFISEHLNEKIINSSADAAGFTLVRPETFVGSHALVYMIHNRKNEPIGAIKIQSDSSRGLEEVLSSLAATQFIRASNRSTHFAEVLQFGRLTEDRYFIIFQAAKTNDLDWWFSPNNASIQHRDLALQAAARAVANLHVNPEVVTVETIATFKANALYDVREALTFLETKNLEAHLKAKHLNVAVLHRIRNLISRATQNYDRNLEFKIESFRPGIIHGDLHGGNIFYDLVTNMASFIDFGDLTWFIGKDNQATGDPANDLGRFLGHLLVYDIRMDRLSPKSFETTKSFYRSYLKFRGMTAGSQEEQVLRAGTLFYMNRYFTKQSSDLTGRKFNSAILSQDAIFSHLFAVWQELPKSLPLESF